MVPLPNVSTSCHETEAPNRSHHCDTTLGIAIAHAFRHTTFTMMHSPFVLFVVEPYPAQSKSTMAVTQCQNPPDCSLIW